MLYTKVFNILIINITNTYICKMAYTQTQLDTLEAAIAQGSLEVWYGDKKVVYRNLAEMLQIRDMMRKDLGIVSKTDSRKFANFSKGL